MSAVELPAEALVHLGNDRVAWLTTITDRGTPSPTPVWFLPLGSVVVSFSEPAARKVHNLRARPRATLHFNTDTDGQDVVVIHATVTVEDGHRPSSVPGYAEKYRGGLAAWGMTAAQFDETNTVRLLITPTRVWLGPGT